MPNSESSRLRKGRNAVHFIIHIIFYVFHLQQESDSAIRTHLLSNNECKATFASIFAEFCAGQD